MSELKPCHACGQLAIQHPTVNDWCMCSDRKCFMAKKGWFTHLEWNTRAPRFSPEERAALQVALFYCWNTANHEQGRISGDIIAKMLEGEKP